MYPISPLFPRERIMFLPKMPEYTADGKQEPPREDDLPHLAPTLGSDSLPISRYEKFSLPVQYSGMSAKFLEFVCARKDLEMQRYLLKVMAREYAGLIIASKGVIRPTMIPDYILQQLKSDAVDASSAGKRRSTHPMTDIAKDFASYSKEGQSQQTETAEAPESVFSDQVSSHILSSMTTRQIKSKKTSKKVASFSSQFKLHIRHLFPLKRIKDLMKANESVGMVSSDAPLAMAIAVQCFVLEISRRSMMRAVVEKRKMVSVSNMCSALEESDKFDFLLDLLPIPHEEQ
ncbi:Transcriptional activator HAP5 subunit like protein [Aduncisulcus paluster]|uniref:Transcriptional activator HAP5 subunit like protein n=1 Tax=Aduncisulcus paluster TaxID=2918883 RepID=A0ABQ5KV40_9EUKA|nr:Transcriptional activator HAP5 subunit like protein [Aduncisulcus paluster]